jgi:hypothetical protein
MHLTARLSRSRILRPLSVAAVAAMLTVGLLPLTPLPGLGAQTALACNATTTVGGGNAGGAGGCPPGVPPKGNPASPPSGGASSYWYCSYGNGSWRFPINTDVTPPKVKSQNSTILIESKPNSGTSTAAAWWQAQLDSFDSWFFSNGKGYNQNSSSFFWQNGVADMLASDLMIEPKSANAGNNWTGNPAGGSILHLRTEAARTALMNLQVLSVRTGPDASWWNGFAHQTGPAAYFDIQVVRRGGGNSYTEIFLTVPGSSTARVWKPGTEPTISGFMSPKTIAGAVNHQLDPTGNSDLLYYLPQDSQGLVKKAVKPYVWSALSNSFVPNYPYEILIKRPGDASFKVWTKAQLASTFLPAGTLYNVQVVMPAHSAIYPSIDSGPNSVHAALLQVVQDQMKTTWNQTNNYRSDLGGSYGPGQKGHAFYPAFAYPFFFNGTSSRPATKAEANSAAIGGKVCGSDSISFFNMTFSRDRTSSPSCGTAFVNSASTYNARVKNPDTCWTWWVFQDIPPPKISKQSWDAAVNRLFNPVALQASSTAILVNQQITFKPTAALPPGAINFSLNDPNLKAVLTYNLTQLGITVSLGTTVLKTIKYNTANPAAGYTFSMTVAETPLARLQEPACLAATSAANLLARCGIVFKYDSVSKRVQPYYRFTVQTWWGGTYYSPGLTANNTHYCPLFSSACSTIDPAFASRIVGWNSAFSGVVRANNGNPLAGWPSMSGDPIYNVGFNPPSSSTPVSLDVSVGQTQSQQVP